MRTLKVPFLVALVFTLSSVVIHAQDRSDADATYALKGPVRSFKTEVATFVLQDDKWVEGPKVVQMEATFNTDQNRTDLFIYNKGQLARRIEMKFDGRRMTEAINYDGAGNMWLRQVDLYDDEGRKKGEISYNGDGSVRSKTTFKRNERGQLLETAEYGADGVLMEQFTYKYEGAKLHSYERKIYRAGTLQQTEVYSAPNKRETTIYKPDGSIATKSLRIGQEIAYYNADGSLQKFTTISNPDRLTDELTINQKEPSKRESQIPDQTDSHGNWIKQTKWLTDANGTKPLIVTYRTITYYEK